MMLSIWLDILGGALLIMLLITILYFIIRESNQKYKDLLQEKPSIVFDDVVYTFRDLLSLQWIRRSCKTDNIQCSSDKDCNELCLEGSGAKCKNRICRFENEVTHTCSDGCLSVLIGDTQSGNVINVCVNTSLQNMPDCSTKNSWYCPNGIIDNNGNCTVSNPEYVKLNYQSGIGRKYPFVVEEKYKYYFLNKNPNVFID